MAIPFIPVGNIEADTTSGCAPLPVNFKGNMQYASDYFWDFGDSTSSIDANPKHVYAKKGVYTVKLVLLNKAVCAASLARTNYITVSSPQVAMEVSPLTGCTPLKVRLIDKSVSDSGTKYWDMGDGGRLPVTADTMYYIYKEAPLLDDGYNLSLHLTESKGCSATATELVKPYGPHASFFISPMEGCSTITYKFIPLVSQAAGIEPFTFFWRFGDGDSSSLQKPEKTYNDFITDTVLFRITDALGCSNEIKRAVSVKREYPQADFTAAPTNGSCPPLLVSFKENTTNGSSNIKYWEWDFGDGSKAYIPNPDKVYLKAGHFTVRLKTIDEAGCIDLKEIPDMIHVNGPEGSYSVSSYDGCTPYTVKFSAESPTATKIEWDMGDGTLYSGKEVTHTYTAASSYVPLLILSDSTGCRYELPVEQAVKIRSYPVANFNVENACAGSPAIFTNMSDPREDSIASCLWDFGDGNTSSEANPLHIYSAPGWYDVSLSVSNRGGCADTLKKRVKIYGMEAAIGSNAHGCTGDPLSFMDSSQSDTTIIAWKWLFGDGDSSLKQNPVHAYKAKGLYPLTLIIYNAEGCSDTAKKNFLVGDTAAAESPLIYRATVEDDSHVRLEFAANADVDFYQYLVYRSMDGKSFTLVDSLPGREDTSYIDKGLNTLRNSYCYRVAVQNVCGYVSAADKPAHCTIELKANAGINKALLQWNAYGGWDSVLRYEVYRESVYHKGQFELMDSLPGNVLSYEDAAILCYRTHVYRIKAYSAKGRYVSWSDTAATRPVYVPHVPATELMRATVEDNARIRVEWADQPKVNIKYFRLERSEDGKYYKAFGEPMERNILSATDEEANVHARPYYYRLAVIDSCDDASPYSNIGKSIYLQADTAQELKPLLKWNSYRGWADGVDYYSVEIMDKGGSYRTLCTLSGKDTVFLDNITNLNSMIRYCYRVIAHRKNSGGEAMVSVSNEDCVPMRSTVWIPNAFSPNGDGLNETFQIKGTYLKEFNIKIYDRWGIKVFESDSIDDSWNGRFKGAMPLGGVYKYMIVASGLDKRLYYLNGWVTIVD